MIHYLSIKTIFVYLLILTSISCKTKTSTKKPLLQLGNQYAKDGLFQEAVTTYKRGIVKNPDEPLFARNLGIILVKLGDYKNAIKYLEQSYDSYSDNFDTNYFLAEAYRSRDQYAKAIFHYEKSLRIRIGDPDASRALAWSYYKVRYYKQTMNIVDSILANNQNDVQTTLIKIRTYIKLRLYNKAKILTERTLRQSKAHQKQYLRTLLADIHMESGRVGKAREIYRKVLKEKPLLPGSLYGLGRCYLKTQNWKKAIGYLEQAIRVRPHFVEAYYSLGKAYERKDTAKAVYYYRRFYKMASKDPAFIPILSGVRKKIKTLRRL